MKCFEVIINGERVCTAGVGDDGVLTGIVSFVKRSHSSEAQDDRDSESLDLRIGGLANRGSATEHLEWLNRKLAVGDEITIKIVEAAECDEPNRKEVTFGDCSFCSKKQAEVEKLIAGPAVYICNECVDDCSVALAAGESTGRITMIASDAAEASCSFCGMRPSNDLGIAGVPAARICNQCVKICCEILAQDV